MDTYHVSGHWCKGFQGQRSKVKVIARPDAFWWCRRNFNVLALWYLKWREIVDVKMFMSIML